MRGMSGLALSRRRHGDDDPDKKPDD